MHQPELLRLKRIEVDGLFGIYNHRIDLELNDRVTLLHGPNGVGKTSILQMTNAILREDLAHFRTTPFSRFMLGFHDGSALELRVAPDLGSDEGTHTLTLTNGANENSANVSLSSFRVEALAAKIDFLEPYRERRGMWIDVRDGELLPESEVISRFGHRDPDFNFRQEDLGWFGSFLKNAKAHLIEAERLVRRPRETRTVRGFMLNHRQTISSVEDCSGDFRRRLDDTMADYGRRAQTLDQSFPQRLISATDSLTVEQLQNEMNTLEERTSEYEKIGILDATPDHPFNIGSLRSMGDPTQDRVMTLYVHDTAEKLQVLDDFASRTRLFLANVNAKYRHKRLRLDREHGLLAVSDSGKPLDLDSLSSGEQHELVLHYDLLFRVLPNTVVLIDEPELSLHVAWQKRFLSDLLEIVQLSSFDALIATHSPFIAGLREDLMVELGDHA